MDKEAREEMNQGMLEAATCRRNIERAMNAHRKNPRSMTKAIRAKCIDCSGGYYAEVRNCIIPDCPLYNFRMGRNDG